MTMNRSTKTATKTTKTTMKTVLCSMLLAGGLALAGCGGDAKSSTPTTPEPSEVPTTPVADTAGVPCAQEIARVCAEGFVDGCGGDKTTVHACVAADAAPGGPCSEEVALQCPEGQKDGCLQTPASSARHVCVLE